MGLHSGLAAPRGDGYVAITVHQASRVIGVAHGKRGQEGVTSPGDIHSPECSSQTFLNA